MSPGRNTHTHTHTHTHCGTRQEHTSRTHTRQRSRGWNRENLAPVRHGSFKQLIFNFSDKIYVRYIRTSTVFPLLLPDVTSGKSKNIPVDSHQVELQGHTIAGPHRRIRLQPFLPSSTHSHHLFHSRKRCDLCNDSKNQRYKKGTLVCRHRTTRHGG